MSVAVAGWAAVGARRRLSGCIRFETVSVAVPFDDRSAGTWAIEFSNLRTPRHP